MNSPQPQPAVMKISELCQVLDIGRNTAYEMCHGPLAHMVVRVGQGQTGIRVLRAPFYRWLEAGGVDGAAAKKGR